MLSLLLAVPSCIYSFWHGVIPTSYFLFNDFYTCVQLFVAISLHVYCGIIMSTVCVCMCVFRFMARKLYTFASGQSMAESADSPMNQEILLGGHFYLMVLKVDLKMIFYEPHMWTCTYIHTYTCIIC